MKYKFLPAYLLVFVNVLGFGILMPVLPFIVESYGAPKWVYGLLLTLYSAFQFIGSPLLGALSDERGRKPILIISQLGTLLSWGIFLFALLMPQYMILGISLPLIIMGASRILDGITGGNNSVANAYVSDITSIEEKKYIYGYLGGISGIGFIIGPGIGGLASSSSLGHSGTIIAAIVLSCVTLLSLIFLLKESHPKEKRTPKHKHSFKEAFQITKRIKHANPSPFIKRIFLLKFIFSTMMAFYIATIALFIIDLFDFNEKELGYFMLFAGSFLAFNQAIMSKVFIKRFGAYKTLIIGMLLSTLGLFCLTISDTLTTYLIFYYFLNLGLALSFNTFNTLISLNADPKHQGEIMGISESINSFCNALFPIIAAGLYGLYGYNIYYFIAALPLIALIIAINSKQDHIE